MILDRASYGEGQSHQNGDDGDDDKEFDEGESGAVGGEATHERFLEHFAFFARAKCVVVAGVEAKLVAAFSQDRLGLLVF